MSDMGNPMVGPGGMGPSGLETYQPVEPSKKNGQKPHKRSKKELAQLVFDKLGGAFQAGLSDSSGSDVDPGMVDQLKWTSETGINTPEQDLDKAKEMKNRRKRYLQSRGK